MIPHGLFWRARDGINPRDLDAYGDEFPQSFFDSRNKLRIATAHPNGIADHFRKVICGEGQSCNAACVDVKGRFLTQFNCFCLADEQVLTRPTRALVSRLGRCVEHDREPCVSLAAGRGAQHDVWRRSGPSDSRKGKLQST